jgi:multiple sugar transport system substrate-binding protein
MQNAKCKMQNVALFFAFCILHFAFASCTAHRDSREQVEVWGLGREGEVVTELVPEFERRNPDIHIIVQQIPFNAAHEKLLTAYVGNATPDAAQMGNTWIPEMVALHAIDELSTLHIDRTDYFPGIWDTNVVDGKLYGIPWYVDTRAIFYRKDLLASVGYAQPPKTWAAWVDCMEKLTRERKSRFGVLLPTNEPEQLVELAMTAGAHFLNAGGTRGNFHERAGGERLSAIRAGRFRHVRERTVAGRRVQAPAAAEHGREMGDDADAGARCIATGRCGDGGRQQFRDLQSVQAQRGGTQIHRISVGDGTADPLFRIDRQSPRAPHGVEGAGTRE